MSPEHGNDRPIEGRLPGVINMVESNVGKMELVEAPGLTRTLSLRQARRLANA